MAEWQIGHRKSSLVLSARSSNDVPVRLLQQPIKHVSVKRGLIIDKLVFKLRIVFIMNSSSFNSNLTLTVPDSVQLHFLADNM